MLNPLAIQFKAICRLLAQPRPFPAPAARHPCRNPSNRFPGSVRSGIFPLLEALRRSAAYDLPKKRQMFLPLLGGEGRGEGGRYTDFAPVHTSPKRWAQSGRVKCPQMISYLRPSCVLSAVSTAWFAVKPFRFAAQSGLRRLRVLRAKILQKICSRSKLKIFFKTPRFFAKVKRHKSLANRPEKGGRVPKHFPKKYRVKPTVG